MPGPDLPAADQPFTVDAYRHRWPAGAEKVELIDGVLVFVGVFDDRDAQIARRAYPDRHVELAWGACLAVHPTIPVPMIGR